MVVFTPSRGQQACCHGVRGWPYDCLPLLFNRYRPLSALIRHPGWRDQGWAGEFASLRTFGLCFGSAAQRRLERGLGEEPIRSRRAARWPVAHLHYRWGSLQRRRFGGYPIRVGDRDLHDDPRLYGVSPRGDFRAGRCCGWPLAGMSSRLARQHAIRQQYF